jgi:hypothetical protein
MKKLVLIFFISFSSVFAQAAGESGFSFLKIGFGARNIAMGDLGVVTANDVTALYYNPAMISDFTNPQIFITHNEWIQDVSSEMLGVSFSLFGVPFAFGFNTTTIPGFEVRTQPGPVESTFNVNYFFGSLSTGFQVVDNLSVGITTKFLYENLFSDEASGLGFDFGLYYNDLINGLNIGASVRNLGSMNKLRNESTKLPIDLRIGTSYIFEVNEIESGIIVLGGIQKYTAAENLHIHLGSEILYKNFIAIRAGYITGYDSKGLTTGLGLVWNGVNLDYAFTPFQYGLDNAHTVSLMYTF